MKRLVLVLLSLILMSLLAVPILAQDATAEATAGMSQIAMSNGTTLAIIDGTGGGSSGMGNELYSLSTDGKTGKSLKKFAQSASYFNQVSWSPDGTRLLYFSVDSPGLLMTDADGGNVQTLPFPATLFDWAPDGKTVTAASGGGGSWSVVNVGADMSDMKPVMTISGMDYLDYIRWSADGKWLAYVGTPTGNKDNDEELHIIDSTGSNDQVIVPAGKIERYAMWSPDGTQIAYIGEGGKAGKGLTIVDIASKKTTVVAADANAADWSPDGTQFAYASSAGKLFIVGVDGKKPTALKIPAEVKGQIVAIAWQPQASS
ncbi:MAG: hypothetical protein ABI970_04870 [Chloroflexota bacterium]